MTKRPSPGGAEASEFIEHLRDMASEAPIIQRVNQILAHAVTSKASDIHIETYEQKSVVRIRVDGEIFPVDEIDNKDAPAVVSRIKILSQLDIAERRMPQDGRTKLRVHGKEMDVRVSTVPTAFGESVVMRLLEKNFDLLSLESLHFTPATLQALRHMLALPHGILLVTGPTGSGKSTTLYASLQELEGENLKILTVEDPVEYRLQWLNQVQVQPQIGLSFAAVLRSFLRQDPDVIMIGEMRDGENGRNRRAGRAHGATWCFPHCTPTAPWGPSCASSTWGVGAVPHHRLRGGCAGAAFGAQALHGLQGATHSRAGPFGRILIGGAGAGGSHALPPGGLCALSFHGLPRAAGHP
jgi:hypothetical protein